MIEQDPQGISAATEEMPSVAVPPDEGRSPKRKTSGYRRLQGRHHALVELHERLQDEYDGLLGEYHKIKDKYAKLEAALDELQGLNRQLAEDLRAAKQRPVTPRAFGGLLGQP